ncbi:thioredoxin family protein [Clostridium magnum]|uniref:Thioredoxin n=1 Tax=Clostridium magnum DSM 2767 TaxID=1121326 RepID=A0A162THA7_9CLOT|nr:thioredoxin domain-containing protein [Clostridium magnum]KZL92641.1 thioredoxin-1 [Clostridium magnum DSM 2767]SHI24054.1 thioredoxin [Clostridium magnum DSM 2767]
MKEINDNIFDKEVIENEKPVVVDFWSTSWSSPSEIIDPVIEELDKEYSGKVEFAKINVEENPIASKHLRVSSIPTIMIFKDGKAVESIVDFRPKSDYEQVLNRYI